MWKSKQYTFPRNPERLEMIGEITRIRGLVVTNNTPYFLYLGTNPQPGREDALMVVEPYSDVSVPVDVQQEVFMTHGPAVGILPPLVQATVQWTNETVPLAVRKYGRNVVVPVIAQEVSGEYSSTLTAQSVTAPAPNSSDPTGAAAAFAVPASAKRRSLYRKAGDGGASITSCTLQGSADGLLWIDILGVPEGLTELDGALALPPYLRLNVSTSAPVRLDVFMVVDL